MTPTLKRAGKHKNIEIEIDLYTQEDYSQDKLNTFCSELKRYGINTNKIQVTEESEGFGKIVYKALDGEKANMNQFVRALDMCEGPSNIDRNRYGIILTDKKLKYSNNPRVYKNRKFQCISTGDGINLKKIAQGYYIYIKKLKF